MRLDDDKALRLLGKEGIRIRAVLTEAGYQNPVSEAVVRALSVCGTMKPQVTVYEGCREPLAKTLSYGRYLGAEKAACADAGTMDLRPDEQLDTVSGKTADIHAVTYLIQNLLQSREPVTVAAWGPVTNLACAIRIRPEIAGHICEVVLRAGALNEGDVTPYAEYNMWCDPEAMQILLNAGVPVTMFPLELCRQYQSYSVLTAAYLLEPDVIKRSQKERADVCLDFNQGEGHLLLNDKAMANVTLVTELNYDKFESLANGGTDGQEGGTV